MSAGHGRDTGWKKYLLASGVPLEYEVARLLDAADMSVDADFSFIRKDGSSDKEMSVDIASRWYGLNRSDEIEFTLELLLECKYRSRSKTLLLLPDPNSRFSPVTLGGTVNWFDHLVPFFLPRDAFESLDGSLDFVYKAIEVHDGGAVEQDIRHGINQLRYAAPMLLKRKLGFELSNHPEDVRAFFIAKILVTNAELRVLNEGVSISDVEVASSLSDISKNVVTAIIFSDYGPDYEAHVRRSFSDGDTNFRSAAKELRHRIQGEGKVGGMFSDPLDLWESLYEADRYECRRLSTQFFVTTPAGLPELIERIKAGCRDAFRRRTKTDPLERRTRRRLAKKD
jgi:hypothetical protein